MTLRDPLADPAGAPTAAMIDASALGVVPGDFLRIAVRARPLDTLMLIFSHVEERPGRFTFARQAAALGWDAILLNVPDRSFYVRGIPGLGESAEAAAAALRGVIARLAPRRVVATGISMGGFGALLYGALLDVERVVALGAETVLLGPGSRSAGFIAERFVPTPADLRPLIGRAATRCDLVFGETDVVDAHAAWRVHDLANVRLHPVRHAGHEVGRWLVRHRRLDGFLAAVAAPAGELDRHLDRGDAVADPGAVECVHDGHAALHRGHAREAVAPLIEGARLAPHWAAAHGLLGRALASVGRRRESIVALRRAVELDPESSGHETDLAVALAATGAHREAANCLARVTARDPDCARAHHYRGIVLGLLGEWDEAERAHLAAVERDGGQLPFAQALGLLYLERRRWPEAIAALQRAIAIDGRHAPLFEQLARALVGAGRAEEAQLAAAQAGMLAANPAPDAPVRTSR